MWKAVFGQFQGPLLSLSAKTNKKCLAYTKVIALVILISAGLYTLFFTDKGVVENFTTLAWANSKFEAGPIVLGLYQVFIYRLPKFQLDFRDCSPTLAGIRWTF